MNIFLINPILKETPDLFSTFKPMFEANGHSFTDKIEEATVVFMDLYSFQANYYTRELDIVFEKKMDVVMFDGSDYGGCKDGTDTWFGFNEPKNYDDIPQAQNLYWKILGRNKVVYFMRKMDKTLTFPRYVYSFELLMYDNCIFEPVSKEDLFNRPYDIFFAGNESPARKSVYEGLKDTGLKLDWTWTNEEGKMEYFDWLGRAKQSKLFLSSDGGGFSCERIYQLSYLATILKQKNNQFVLRDFTQGFNCLKVSETPLEKEIEFLKMILENKERLHSIYLNGIKNIERFYTSSFRSSYILQVLFQNYIN